MFSRDKMNLNGFSLGISVMHGDSEKVKIDGVDYFSLAHNSEYSLLLSNTRSVKCDAHVSIDGEEVGVWRINPYATINIERPVDVKRKFVFLAENSTEAEDAGIPQGSSKNGLIKVVFTPEKTYHDERQVCFKSGNARCDSFRNTASRGVKSLSTKNYGTESVSMGMTDTFSNSAEGNFSAGATGLGDRSFQNFSTVGKLTNIDQSNVTTIQTRLVVSNYDSSPRVVRLRDGLQKTPYPRRIETQYPKRVDRNTPLWHLSDPTVREYSWLF